MFSHAVCRYQHYAAVGGLALCIDKHVQAAQARHGNVGKDQVKLFAIEQSDRSGRLGNDRAVVPMPAEFVANEGAHRRVVVHGQHSVGTYYHDTVPHDGHDPISSDIGKKRAALKLQQQN